MRYEPPCDMLGLHSGMSGSCSEPQLCPNSWAVTRLASRSKRSRSLSLSARTFSNSAAASGLVKASSVGANNVTLLMESSDSAKPASRKSVRKVVRLWLARTPVTGRAEIIVSNQNKECNKMKSLLIIYLLPMQASPCINLDRIVESSFSNAESVGAKMITSSFTSSLISWIPVTIWPSTMSFILVLSIPALRRLRAEAASCKLSVKSRTASSDGTNNVKFFVVTVSSRPEVRTSSTKSFPPTSAAVSSSPFRNNKTARALLGCAGVLCVRLLAAGKLERTKNSTFIFITFFTSFVLALRLKFKKVVELWLLEQKRNYLYYFNYKNIIFLLLCNLTCKTNAEVKSSFTTAGTELSCFVVKCTGPNNLFCNEDESWHAVNTTRTTQLVEKLHSVTGFSLQNNATQRPKTKDYRGKHQRYSLDKTLFQNIFVNYYGQYWFLSTHSAYSQKLYPEYTRLDEVAVKLQAEHRSRDQYHNPRRQAGPEVRSKSFCVLCFPDSFSLIGNSKHFITFECQHIHFFWVQEMWIYIQL
ncbi:hypothetical protein C0J52_02153 [Blattella germanica]|nr:hypothetical protein C0J52_02153 [Blattella germanica]